MTHLPDIDPTFLDDEGFVHLPGIPSARWSEFFPGLLTLRDSTFPKQRQLDVICLDNGATTQMPKPVVDRFREWQDSHIRLSDHSGHGGEQDLTRAVVRRFFGAEDYHVSFSSGTTASLQRLGIDFKYTPETLLLIAEDNHHSHMLSARKRAGEKGATVKYIPVDEHGILDLEWLERETHGFGNFDNVLINIVHASNVSGVIHDVPEIRRIVGDEALISLDMAQSAVHVYPLCLDDLGVNFAAVSSHKMHGPTGLGALFVKKGDEVYLGNLVSGGHAVLGVSQNHTAYAEPPERFEAGTQALDQITAWRFALEHLMGTGMENILAQEHTLAAYLRDQLGRIPGVRLYGPEGYDPRLQTSVTTFNIGSSQTNYELVRDKLKERKQGKKPTYSRAGCFCAHILVARLTGKPMADVDAAVQAMINGRTKEELGVPGAVRVIPGYDTTLNDCYSMVLQTRDIAREIL